MRIVLVNHTFPPASWAGSEICVLRTAQELKRRGHEVAVFTRDASPDRDEYVLADDEIDGIPVTRITKNFRYTPDFDSIYRDDFLAARFGDWIGGLQPDLVHLHHLTNLSTTLTRELHDRGIPTLMTLHDYWLHCQRGQLLTRTLKRCDGPSVAGCRDCLAAQTLRGRAQRLVGGFVARERRAVTGANDGSNLIAEKPEVRETPDARFIDHADIDIGGDVRTVLLMHPPSRCCYRIDIRKNPSLEIAYAMFPSTYEMPGGGVRFMIEINGECIFDECIDAKANPEQRRWFESKIDLTPWAGQTIELTLGTVEEQEGNNQHCSAGWGCLKLHDATIHKASKSDSLLKRKILRAGFDTAARLAAAVFPSATYAIRRRREAVRCVLEEVDHFISPSQFLRDFFVHEGLDPKRITFLDNGFALHPALETGRKPWPESGAPLQVGYIGTWIPSKGLHLLIEAFNGLPHNAAELHIHGFFPGYDGYENYESQLRESARHPGINFHGAYAPETVHELLAHLDVIVVPSIWWENSPLTIHEAFQSRIPVITANAGGMAEFVPHEKAGLQFEHRNAASLRAALQRILNEPGLLQTLRDGIPAIPCITEHADRLLDLYNKVVREKQHPWKLPVEFVTPSS